MHVDLKCDFCGKANDGSWYGFTCRHCHGYFCPDHRLPEAHGCVVRMPVKGAPADEAPLTRTASYTTRTPRHHGRRAFRWRPGRRLILPVLLAVWAVFVYVLANVASAPMSVWYVGYLLSAGLALYLDSRVYWWVDRNAGNAGRTFLLVPGLIFAAILVGGFSLSLDLLLPAPAYGFRSIGLPYNWLEVGVWTNLTDIFLTIVAGGLFLTALYAAYRLRHRVFIN